jgi:hypothetical protein
VKFLRTSSCEEDSKNGVLWRDSLTRLRLATRLRHRRTVGRQPGELVDYSPKAPCVNDFVGFLAVWEEAKNLLTSVIDQHFGFAPAHRGLADESCGYIDNVRDFPRSPGFVSEFLGSRHRCRP